MMKRTINKRISELDAWDLDAGCHNIINQSTPARRRLKKVVRRQDRKRINRYFEAYEKEHSHE